MTVRFGLRAFALMIGSLAISLPAQPEVSTHQIQMQQLAAERPVPSEDGDGIAPPAPGPGLHQSAPTMADDFIVFGYAQSDSSDTFTDFYRWNALTHVGSTFITFDSTGNITNPGTWTGRDEELRPGGAAQAAGTKVIMVVLNSGFDVTVINTVMASAAARAILIDDIGDLLQADGYSHGVSFDFEPFSWNAAATAGMTTFFADLRADLDARGLTDHEISIYADPTPSGTGWNLAGFTPNLDYYLYSCYDFGTGLSPHAISDFNGYIVQINDFYLDGGVPANKFVAVISSYSRQWAGTSAYNSPGTSSSSQGFTDGQYETTLEPDFSGPYANNYVTGDEVGWYTYNDGNNQTVTWDNLESLEYKIRAVLSNQDPESTHSGERLRGVGFWSLMWFAETSSYKLLDNEGAATSVTRTRTYPHIYQLCERLLSPPGDERYTIEGFEGSLGVGGFNFRWRDPNTSLDETGDTDNDSTRTIISKPAGGPADSTTAMQVNFDFDNASGNLLFFRHEVLNAGGSVADNAVVDTNSALAHFDANNAVIVQLHTPAAYSGRQMRMVVMEMPSRQLECSDPFTLNASGWRECAWDLTDASQINAYNTNENSFVDGNGVLNTAGAGAEDIAFIGFVIEGGAAGTGSVTFDELAYEHRNPGGLNYTINEVRYATGTTAGTDTQEFIEVHGPAGAIPANTDLRIYNSANGAVLQSIALGGQVIPADGHLVVGDTAVSNVDVIPAGWGAADNLPGLHANGAHSPAGLQIYNTVSGNVYDSVIYEAMGGIDDLIRRQARNVADEGYPWLGEIAGGAAGGSLYTMGRYPDGTDTNVNFDDFSVAVATPGASNGGAVTLGESFNFTAAPPEGVAAYQTFTVASPSGAGLPNSPSGGNAHRCVDTSGGGQLTFLGDAALGAANAGYTVTGEVYIPSGAAPAQATAIGLCGRQGSTFFSGSPGSSGYDSGYWLIYENAAGVGLNDGQADHAGTFELVLASNDNMDATRVSLIASKTLANLGITAGTWVTFSLTVDPTPFTVGQEMIIQLNGVDVYRGTLPAGGPTSGAFQVGFRENHAGAPAAGEGTWVDNVAFGTAVPAGLTGFMVD